MVVAAEPGLRPGAGTWRSLELRAAAMIAADAVVETLASTAQGLSSEEASRRLADVGPNALRSHGARPLAVFARQLRNPLLILLVSAASLWVFVGLGVWGMSDVIGPVTVITEEGQLPLPGASDISPVTQQLVDEEVRHLIEQAHEQVTQLKLDALANALLEHETLEQDEAYAAAGIPAPGEAPLVN